jgi:uncharacterized protein (TIGR00251 family)
MTTKLKIKVIPGAKKSTWDGMFDGNPKIRIHAPPVDGAANEELIRFAAESFGLKKSQVQLVSGEKSRLKTLEINLEKIELEKKLAAIEAAH